MDVNDVAYEEELLRNPYSFKNWWYYIEYKSDTTPEARYLLFERALKHLPRSYKLWYTYLMERKDWCKNLPITDVEYSKTNAAFDRALVHMHKFPVIWKEYFGFLAVQKTITKTRRTFDLALRALPITQHLRWVWPMYLEFARGCGVPETAIRIYKRYLKLNPDEIEDYIKFLKSVGKIGEAAEQLAKLVNDEKFISQHSKSKHDLWKELLNMITKNPKQCSKLNVEAIIRSGISRYPSEVGYLWTALADFNIRLGHFEKARDVYEEGIQTVNTVRDFSLIFDAYSQFEESMLTANMETAEAMQEEESEDSESDSDDDLDAVGDSVDLDMRLARLEHLMSRRELLLNSVLLRQNPHNVQDWLNRVKLFKDDPAQIIMTYKDAVTTVDPQQATGKPHQLWIEFAKFYETYGDLTNARTIYEKGALMNYRTIDELATLWCTFCEMELRHKNYDRAVTILQEACVAPTRATMAAMFTKKEYSLPVQKRLWKSTKLWSFLADLQESLGSLESTKAVYEQMIDLKVCSPQIIINFAKFMEDQKYFEESFRIYEKGISLFDFPHVLPIWLAYLKKFTERYKGKRLERTRDLFEEAVSKAPGKEGRILYLLFAKYEETYGTPRRAMKVYDRACNASLPTARLEMYQIYISRCAEFFGVTKTREIFEKAMSNLPDAALKKISNDYAELEQKLGEVDRARAIYMYASQLNDPRVDKKFWSAWYDFEVQYGNQDTYQDMCRVRRSVLAEVSQLNMTAALAPETAAPTEAPRKKGAPVSALEALERNAKEEDAQAAKQAALARQAAAQLEAQRKAAAKVNTDEISLDSDDDDDAPSDVQQKAVPAAVFGSIATGGSEPAAAPMGALDRFKKKA